jgi:hypothetical protein
LVKNGVRGRENATAQRHLPDCTGGDDTAIRNPFRIP